MASIKISNLPDLQSGSVSANDYFIVNDENQTTSKLKFTEFVTALGNQNYVFSGDVSFTGQLSVNIVDDTSSNVYTKSSVNTLIAESEARTLIPVTENATDISQLQNLLPAPTSGGLFLAGTFSGAAAAATQVVPAINAVAVEVGANTTLAQQGVDDAAAAQTDATAAIASAADLGAQIGTVGDDVTDTTINGKLNATGQGLNELKAAAATALAVFQTGGATDQDKLNATQSFFDTIQALTVTA